MSEAPDLIPTAPRGVAALSPVRLFYWSLRRELWENRSLYIAPLCVGSLVLFGFVLSTAGLPHRRHVLMALDPAAQAAAISRPFDAAAMAVFATMFIVAAAYCLGALHGERRDRSILFWKSLPVSDALTVLAKAALPIVVMPVIAFSIIVAVQLVMALVSTAILAGNYPGAASQQFAPLQTAGVLAYGLVTMSLWWAPLYSWLLLVSGWARRVPLLWAALPPLGLALVERIAFGSSTLGSFIRARLVGGFPVAFVLPRHGSASAHHSMATSVSSQIDPGRFLSSLGLWSGLALAAAFLAAAVWLRRRQEPI